MLFAKILSKITSAKKVHLWTDTYSAPTSYMHIFFELAENACKRIIIGFWNRVYESYTKIPMYSYNSDKLGPLFSTKQRFSKNKYWYLSVILGGH